MNEPKLAQPKEIDTSRHFWNTFDNMEREVSARWIVKFCQNRGQGWTFFTVTELEHYYCQHGFRNFWFNGLIEQGYLLRDGDNITITPEFVVQCMRAGLVEAKS